MPSYNAQRTVLMSVLLSSLTATAPLVTAYVINPTHAPALYKAQQPTSALASKVIYQSPSVENMYKEFLVSSKPLTLRKYANGVKGKKTKKDSKIYYIPIPPLPYRYIPGVGYDYQPMKINPIIKETTALPSLDKLDAHAAGSSASSVSIKPQTQQQQQQQVLQHQQKPQQHQQQQQQFNSKHPVSVASSAGSTAKPEVSDNANAESKVFHMQRGNYYYNGRPFRLQVAHAHPKHQLTPQNLKSKLYFNKKFIY